MPLQNRVTPFGEIAALPGRGLFVGNRGILHDDARRVVRAWQCKRWITCRLEFKGIRRRVMTPHTWTELFFLDEAAAFAAGHRPCAECRRDAYLRYRTLWESARGGPASADAMDAILHEARLDGRRKRTYRAAVATLPDGAFVALGGEPWLVWDDALFAWSDGGYTARRARPHDLDADVLTPQPSIAVLRAGYRPQVHPSAFAVS